MNWFDWLFPSQAQAAAGEAFGPPMPGGDYGPPIPQGLGATLEPYGPPQSAQPIGPPMSAMVPMAGMSTPDGSTVPDQSAPEAASQQAGVGWQDRLANVLKNVKAPPPPDVVKPSTPPPPRPHPVNNDFTRILLARAQAGGGQPSVPLALGRVLGGR